MPSERFPRRRVLRRLTDAGGKVYWYHPFRWNTWPRINNRTHRELMIIDGNVGFIGGAGIADHWLKQHGDDRRWRDTVVRVEGEPLRVCRRRSQRTGSNLPARSLRATNISVPSNPGAHHRMVSLVRRPQADPPAPA